MKESPRGSRQLRRELFADLTGVSAQATVLFLLCATAIVGCSSAKSVSIDDSTALEDINRKTARHDVTVVTRDGVRHRVSALRMSSDSASWIDPNVGTIKAAATDEIELLSFSDHGKGAGQGLGIGVLTGVTVGVTLPFWEPNTDCSSWNDETVLGSCGAWAMAFGVAGGLLGGIIGPIFGGIIGSRQVYVLRRPHDTRQGQ